MIDGKKIKASKIIFEMLSILEKKIKKNHETKTHSSKFNEFGKKIVSKIKNQQQIGDNLFGNEIEFNFSLFQIISKALENITPNLEVRKVRVAGTTYLVPAIFSKKKQETLALKWIIDSAKKRQKNSKLHFAACLAEEILDASKKLGQARQKRDELHRLAQQNRAYTRYRWW